MATPGLRRYAGARERTLRFRRIFDAHVHFREDDFFPPLVRLHAEFCGRAIAIGNTREGLTDAASAVAYEARARAIAPEMITHATMMLTQQTTPRMICVAHAAGIRFIKVLFRGTTTHSHYGVSDIWALRDVFHELEKLEDIAVLIHCEQPDAPPETAEVLALPMFEQLVREFRGVRFSLEHISTAEGVALIDTLPPNAAGTVTLHHQLLTREHVRDKDGVIIDPFSYCKPEPKGMQDREAVALAAMHCGRIGFGSDAAPHDIKKKRGLAPMPGIWTAKVLVPLTVELFRQLGVPDRVDEFMSGRMSRFYRLPPPEGTIELIERKWTVPEIYVSDGEHMVGISGEVAARVRDGGPVEEGGEPPTYAVMPFHAGSPLSLQLSSPHSV